MRYTLLKVVFALILFFATSVSAQNVYQPWVQEPVLPENFDLKPEGSLEAGLQTGSGLFSYPLKLPPGTSGLASIVSIDYNNQQAKGSPGLLGAGWVLTENYIQRNVNYTFSDTSDDEYILQLNGQSYRLVSSGGGRYHTKIESHLYINKTGDHWLVISKDGTRFRFGGTSDSSMDSNLENFVWRWSLDQIEDTHGNKVYYTYRENPGANDIGAVYPYNITYNNDQKRRIIFILETSDRPDLRLSYTQGHRLQYSRRIKEIHVRVDSDLVRKYVLEYTNDSKPTVTLLSSITVVGNDDSTELPETVFEYKQVWSGWVRDDSWILPTNESAGADEEPVFSWFDGGQYNDMGTRLIDVNGDGLLDVIKSSYFHEKGYTNKAWVNNGSDWIRDDSWIIPINESSTPTEEPVLSIFNGATYGDMGTRLVDLDGDGLVDIIKSYYSNGDPSGFHTKAWVNNGAGWSRDDNWILPVNTSGNVYGEPVFTAYDGSQYGSLGTRLVDVNGDGLPDIIKSISTNEPAYYGKAWINNGSGWERADKWIMPVNESENSIKEPVFIGFDGSSYGDLGVRLIDVNADGLPDILKSSIRIL